MNTIVFPCPCGNALQAPPEQIGQSVPCPRCGASVTVPNASADGFHLVYAPGMQELGQAMSMEDIQQALHNGTLTSHDLILWKGTWLPFGAVFELPDPAPPETAAEQPALPTSFSQLPPIPNSNPKGLREDAALTARRKGPSPALLIALALAVIAGIIAILLIIRN